MPTIDLREVPKYVNPRFRPLFLDEHRFNALVGGASSGKSYSSAQRTIYRTLKEPGRKYLVVRKVAKTIRHSFFALLQHIIGTWGMTDLFTPNKTDMTLTCRANGNEILSAGLDDVEKLKSIYGITDIIVEEASEITEADFNQLDLRLRGKTAYKKQITLQLNPISTMHWIKKRFFDRSESGALTHHSTYRDNLFLDSDTRERLEMITDPYFRDVYVDGKWGVFGFVVFTDFVIEQFDFGEDDLENVCSGMDFGTVHGASIERLGFRDGEIYAFDELYGKGWTNPDFIGAANEYWTEDSLKGPEITADSAEPDRIIEWCREGYNVVPAKKGPGSLGYGIDFLKSRRIHIHETRCPQLAREIQAFQRKVDRNGDATEGFVEINDDCIAAARYATEYLWAQYHGQLAPYDLAAIGL